MGVFKARKHATEATAVAPPEQPSLPIEGYSLALGAFAVLLVTLYVLKKYHRHRMLTKFQLKGKHVLITGGSSGIGKAIALQVLQQGAFLTLVARDLVKLKKAQSELLEHVKSNSKQQVSERGNAHSL